MNFPTKRPHEEVLLWIKKHPLVYLKTVFMVLVIGGLPLVLFLVALSLLTQTIPQIVWLIAILYLVVSLLVFYLKWLEEVLDIVIVTDQRLVDMDQYNIFRRAMGEVALEQITDVTGTVKGIFGTIFNYGSIRIETAGQTSDFSIRDVAHPILSAQRILDIVAGKREKMVEEN